MRLIFRFILFFLLGHQLYATHYRAGEIRYENLRDKNGVPSLKFRVIVTTYVRAVDINTDRCELMLYIGVNRADSFLLTRRNGLLGGGAGNCQNKPFGELLNYGGVSSNDLYKKNVYVADTVTFASSGVYKLFVIDRNRVDEVVNIPNSINEPFTLESEIDLTINNFRDNSAPVFNNLPLDVACNLKCFYHNPGAVDADGDSLAYFIDTCRGSGLSVIPGYSVPNNIIMLPDGTFSWCVPSTNPPAVYNFAIRVEEYRKWNGVYQRIGYVIRDFQVEIKNCLNNPPNIIAVDTCIEAGSTAIINVKATDQDNNFITLSATGQPFNFNPKATFVSNVNVAGNATSKFTWSTKCDQIKNTPYSIVVKAIDNSTPFPLVRYQSFNVRVIGSPVKNLGLQAFGSKVKVTWAKPDCAIAKTIFNANGIVGYSVYRKLGCDTFKFDPCKTTVDPLSGYTLVGGTTSIDSLAFTDDNGGAGLQFSQSYSYCVVPKYFDGASSKISEQICISLSRSVPGIINVDIVTTEVNTGKIFVRWLKPLIGGQGKLDTLVNSGPYKFELRRFDLSNANDQGVIVKTVSKPFFKSINALSDTTFEDNGLNTKEKQYKYRVDLFATPAAKAIGNSNTATSTFLKLKGNNKKLILTWNATVPWENYLYAIYQETTPNTFVLVDTTSKQTDTIFNLINSSTYCFKIVCRGKYVDVAQTYDSLINASQIACGSPNDVESPCDLSVTLLADCESSALSARFNFVGADCDSNDILKFKLWRSATDTGKFAVIDSIINTGQRVITFVNTESLAGCYAVTAIDSSLNESVIKNKVCIDNCDFEFELPNIFTPNGDTANELFTPIRKKVRFVNGLDFKIYDRWGLLVYETKDILINWNGKNKATKQECSDGVYFYVANARIGRLKGEEVKKFTGYIHLQRSN
jgi:gliding motility-associated-like protein